MPSSSVLVSDPPSADPAASTVAPALTVGALDLCEKDRVLLRSLVRLLDGCDGLHLTYGESAHACRVVFVPAGWPHRLPPGCIVVRVVDAAAADPAGSGLRVHAPLRSSNVGAVLHAAAAMVARADAPAAPGGGLVDLFHLISRLVAARERRCTSVSLDDGAGTLLIDFEARVVHGSLSQQALLAGAYRVGVAQGATPAERACATSLPAIPIAELFWRAAQRLGDEGRAGTAVPGRLRLVRWPDAVALSRPGMPRLVALLTSRPMSCAEAAAASGLAAPVVHWFVQACLALGLARPCSGETSPGALPASPEPPAAHSLLVRLRQHLKLW